MDIVVHISKQQSNAGKALNDIYLNLIERIWRESYMY